MRAEALNRLSETLDELGVEVDPELFELALVHRSYAYENGGIPTNERLEFLGDAVLQIVVTEHLFKSFPEHDEGQLAKLRAAVVSATALAAVAKELHLGEQIKLGRGEVLTSGHKKTSILADAFEAVIGAIYLSSGMSDASKFIHATIDTRIVRAAKLGDRIDPKTALQEICSNQSLGVPEYVITEEGPDHQKVFTAHVIVDGKSCGEGVGSSKRHAEQIAAREALKGLSA